MTSEDKAIDMLLEIAVAAESDIVGDFPEIERGYDMFVERLPRTLESGEVIQQLYGVISMGDAFSAVYQFCEQDRYDNQEWIQTNEDPFEIEEEILRYRRRRSGL